MPESISRARTFKDSLFFSLAGTSLTRSLLLKTLIGVLIIAAVVGPRTIDLDVFYARDELAIWPWADQFATAIFNGDLAGTFTTSDYPGIPMFWVQTAFLAVKYSFPFLFQETMVSFEQISEVENLTLLAERRLAAGLFISLQILVAVWLLRRLFGWTSAVLSAILLGLDPFSLTEARVLRLEMISAVFVCLSVLAFLGYLRWRGRKWVLISGVLAGLAVSSKTSAGLLVPYIWVLLLFDLFVRTSPAAQPLSWLAKTKRLISDGLLWAAGAIGAFWLIWPAMWVKPVEALRYIFVTGFGQAANRSVWGDKVFFWGQVIDGGDPGPWFYPVVFAFRTTPLIWLGLAAALVMGIVVWRGSQSKILNRQSKIEARWPAVGILLLFTFIILLIVELTFVISKVDRFLLLVLPIVNILSALGLALVLEWPGRWGTGRPSPWWRFGLMGGGVAAILAWQLTITLPEHPYYLSYWNSWLGGGRAAMETVPMGAGEGIDQMMAYLNRQPNAAEISMVCGASQPWCENGFPGEILRFASYATGEWARADYASFYISHLQRRRYPPEIVDFFWHRQTPRYQVELGGATYVWLYEVPAMDYFAGTWNDLAGLGRLSGYTLSPVLAGGTGTETGGTVEATVWWTNLGAGVDNLILRWLDGSGYEWGRAPVVPQPEYGSLPADKRAILSGTATLTIPPGTPPGTYFLRIGVAESDGDTLLGEFKMPDEGNKLVVRPGQMMPDPAAFDISNVLNRPLAPEVTLLGYDRPNQVLTAELPTWLSLYWQATSQPEDYLVLLRLLDRDGIEVTRWLGRPAQSRYPTSNWRAGEIVKDVWPLQVDPNTPLGHYDLEISLFRAAEPVPTSEQLERVVIENIEVWPQPVQYEMPEMQARLDMIFDDRLTLLGYDLYFDTEGAGQGALAPVFYWRSQAEMQAAYDLLLTLQNADTTQAVNEWRLPLGGDGPKTFWKANEVVQTAYELEVGTIDQGRYHLDIVVQRRNGEPAGAGDDARPVTSTRIGNIQDKIVVRLVNQQ